MGYPPPRRLPAAPMLKALEHYHRARPHLSTRAELAGALRMDSALLYRVFEQEELTLYRIDKLCAEIGLHPVLVYGPAWERA